MMTGAFNGRDNGTEYINVLYICNKCSSISVNTGLFLDATFSQKNRLIFYDRLDEMNILKILFSVALGHAP